ncbi:MAG: hypothetical protein WBL63_20160 [Candidatus Acidiferrum sp.]
MVSARKIRRVLANLLIFAGIALLTITALGGSYFLPQELDAHPYACIPRPEFVHSRLTLPYTDKYAVAQVASYDDELEAFLYFQFLRGHTASEGIRIVLTAVPAKSGPSYRIFVVGQDDLLTDIPRLGRLEGRRLIPHTEITVWSENEFSHYQYQSHIFEVAVSVPVTQKLEALDPSQLETALADFLLFKSQTDIRVLEDLDSKPQPLTRAQAEQSAADIISVARFYDLPLDYFLGVGAMENNYMDVNGDLTHAVWKNRPQSGDIILRRHRKRVLVSDYSIGAWQITRETIRAAHGLYLRDKRDYSLLPERLRPPRQLDLNSVDGPILTTYAGLLLRDLLDHFHGDVQKAIGAYNGGTKTPNSNYAFAVAGIAEYARRVLEHAPVLKAEDPVKLMTTSSSSPWAKQSANAPSTSTAPK